MRIREHLVRSLDGLSTEVAPADGGRVVGGRVAVERWRQSENRAVAAVVIAGPVSFDGVMLVVEGEESDVLSTGRWQVPDGGSVTVDVTVEVR